MAHEPDNVIDFGVTPFSTFTSGTSDANIDGLLFGDQWTDFDIAYSFPDAGRPLIVGDKDYGPGYVSGFPEDPLPTFSAFTPRQEAAAVYWLNQYAAVSGLTFVELDGARFAQDEDQEATLKFANSQDPDTAYAYPPGFRMGSEEEGDMWFGPAGDLPDLGNYDWHSIGHELGHALGLKHGHEGGGISGAMDANRDSQEFTIMTYRDFIGHDPSAGSTTETWGYAQTLMMYDIAAIQFMYGANFNTNSGDTIYTFSTTTGEMFIDGIGQGKPGNVISLFDNRIFRTIWDGDGDDTYDFSNYTTDLNIDLTPGGWVDLDTSGNFQRANLGQDASGVDQFSRGHVFNALQYQGDSRSLIENAIGGSGNDEITGNAADNDLVGNGGIDTIYGEAGNDTIDGGAEDDIIGWVVGDGRDIIDGGLGTDQFLITTSHQIETYFIETVVDYTARVAVPEPLAVATDIVVSRAFVVGASTVIAELDRVEDIDVLSAFAALGDTYIVSGDFVGTDLDPNTITITGTGGDDTVDLSGLVSVHGVNFITNGGNDQLIGGNANTSVILSEDFATYQQSINPDGSLTLSSASGSFTTDNNLIIIQDPGNQGGGIDLNITPVAQDDSFEIDEDTILFGNVLIDNSSGVDFDFDGDDLSVALVGGGVNHGSLMLNGDGSFTYTPDLNYFGLESFDYTVDDDNGGHDTATAYITVINVNDPAIISGLVEGAVTEDTATLSTMGELNISDVDSPNEFQEGPYMGAYGILELTKSGDWAYFVLNGHEDVQDLDSEGTLSDLVDIKSHDGTSATIEITINGTDEPKGNANGEALDGTVLADGNLYGGAGADVVTGLSENDVVYGGERDDLVQGGWGDDTVHGGEGSDNILGDVGNDSLFGDEGRDTIHGGPEDDHIDGGDGRDILQGDEGEDLLIGGHDKDILIGGLDSDTFVLELDGVVDTVRDLEIDEDGMPIDYIGLVDGTTLDDVTIENNKKGGVLVSVNGVDEMLIENVVNATQIHDDFFINV